MERAALRVGLALGILLGAWSQSAWAQVQQQFGQPPNTYLTWGSPPPNSSRVDVTYFIGPGFSAPQVNLINQAAQVWSNAGGGVRFVEVFVQAGSNVPLTYTPLGAGTLANFNRTTTGVLGTYPDGNPYRRITGDATSISSSVGWWTGTGSAAGLFDFYSVMLDLFGLGLGLGFANGADPTSVMQQTFAPGVSNETLSPRDVQGLQAIYGTPEPATWALFGVGLASLGLARRLRR